MGKLESQADLLCRNGCGFYGNPEWNWFCSKCWRLHQKEKKKMRVGTEAAFVPEQVSSSIPSSASFSKFEDKKKRQIASQNTKQNIKHIFKKGHRSGSGETSPSKHGRRHLSSSSSSSSTSSPGRSSYRRPELSPEAKAVSNEFANFLNLRLERTGVADISRQVKSLIDRITKTAEMVPIDDVSNIVQEFYRQLQKRLENHQLFTSLTDEDRDKILDFSERYVMICCYKLLFCPLTTNDEEKDLELQNRIRSLNWISTQDLKCSISETSQEVRDLLYTAINDILEMDGKMPPQEKMESLVTCCKNIFQMLKISNTSPASADDFLPCLIYVCLKANPPRIQSNINYITKFCNENKLRMGEGGYFFANLCCAMSFIENLEAKSIGMNEDEFESYVSGRAIPPGSWQSSLLMCEGLQVMSQNLKTLSELKHRHDLVLASAVKLKNEMNEFQTSISAEVAAVLERTKYEIRGPKKPIAVDAPEPENPALPPPLIPSLLGEEKINLAAAAEESAAKSADVDSTATCLEDYLSISNAENASLLSLDVSSLSEAEGSSSRPEPEVEATKNPASSYQGFSSQSSLIPSISCDNAIGNENSSTSEEEEDSSSSSSSAVDSVKEGSGGGNGAAGPGFENNLAKVLTGVYRTFDNLF